MAAEGAVPFLNFADRSGDWLRTSDHFDDNRKCGRVIGSSSASGGARHGIDVEGVISIDNGALRIAPLIEAGFGRAVVSYGPFAKKPGLAFAVHIVNGHNTAQAEPLPDTFAGRMRWWLHGSQADPPARRIVHWLGSGRVRRVLRQVRRWRRSAHGAKPVPRLDENLAVGWFPAPMVDDPRVTGDGFVMHALGPENGELWVVGSGARDRGLHGVQNLPLYLVGIVRTGSVVYYASSIDGARGLPPYPLMRPVAIGREPDVAELYLGIHQSVLGQIGWRLDTRVHGVRIGELELDDTMLAGAHAADALLHIPSSGSVADRGGPWVVTGASPVAEQGADLRLAVLDPLAPSGLLEVTAQAGSGRAGLVWRYEDHENHWQLVLTRVGVELAVVVRGERRVLATRELDSASSTPCRLSVLDDGKLLMAFVDGEPIREGWIDDDTLSPFGPVGIVFDTSTSTGRLRKFEAHPRTVQLPLVFQMGSLEVRKGKEIVVADDFLEPTRDLDGCETGAGGTTWQRIIGTGTFSIRERGRLAVEATADRPIPGRTAYCIDWLDPEFADLEVTITPPAADDPRHIATPGFILYQDPDNYVTLNAYRSGFYPAGSVSTFFKFDGFEDVYDAIWSNVGDRVSFGVPVRLRLCCDGLQYLVYLNDEAVLYRAFTDVHAHAKRLRINKVGLIANWEFGTDTGSTFARCRMRV